jgi:hydrogenase maturation protease
MEAEPKEVSQNLRILITGVGNVLRQDDGFGVEVINRLLERNKLPAGVKVMETGIGGIRLVQELLDGYDILILVDAVQRDGQPGQLYLLEADVPDLDGFSFDERNEFLADMHYTNPTRAMMLAKAIHVLPPRVYILGCQPAAYDDFELGLSPEVEAAIPAAISQIEAWIVTLNQEVS